MQHMVYGKPLHNYTWPNSFGDAYFQNLGFETETDLASSIQIYTGAKHTRLDLAVCSSVGTDSFKVQSYVSNLTLTYPRGVIRSICGLSYSPQS